MEEDLGKIESFELKVPVELHFQEGVWTVIPTKETEDLIGFAPCCLTCDTKEKAIKLFWEVFREEQEELSERSHQLDLWKPFQRGGWKGPGTHWFVSYGFHVYFRHGTGMQGGFYIPFTLLNVSIRNYWKRK
jgi:hypothetical protein